MEMQNPCTRGRGHEGERGRHRGEMVRGPMGMGGGSMVRAAGRAVGAGVGAVQERFPQGATAGHGGGPAHVVSVSSSSASSGSSPSRAASSTDNAGRQPHPQPCFCGEDGWVPVGDEEAEEATEYGFDDCFVFGPVPSRDEVVDAVSTIQQILLAVPFSQDVKDHFSSIDKTMITASMHRVPSSESESDWIEPAFQLCSSNGFQSQAYEKAIDAFRLLQMNPSVKRTVISLSSDKAVWDAVMKNEAVQELRASFYAATIGSASNSGGDRNALTRIIKVLQRTKARLIELVEKIAKVVSELLSLPDKGQKSDLFEDALRSSFMLSVGVLIVVIITRVHKA